MSPLMVPRPLHNPKYANPYKLGSTLKNRHPLPIFQGHNKKTATQPVEVVDKCPHWWFQGLCITQNTQKLRIYGISPWKVGTPCTCLKVITKNCLKHQFQWLTNVPIEGSRVSAWAKTQKVEIMGFHLDKLAYISRPSKIQILQNQPNGWQVSPLIVPESLHTQNRPIT